MNTHVKSVGSAWLAQDVAICFVGDQPGYSIDLGYFIPPILTRASLEEAIQRVTEVMEQVNALLLLEPAPITFVVGDMTIYEWLGELATTTDCGLLLDAGHLVSHQFALGKSRTTLLEGLDALPWDRVIELHLAGGVIQKGKLDDDKRYYLDAHELPVLDESWQVFRYVLEHAPYLKAVCYECENADPGTIVWMLDQVRQRVKAGALNKQLSVFVEEGGLRGEHGF